MEPINIFNIRLYPLRRAEFISIIRSNLRNGNQTVQFGVNSATVNDIVRNEEYGLAVANADLLNIDGMSVVWALRFLGYTVPERVATPDLAEGILRMAEKENFSVFFLGAKETVLLSCRNRLQENMPGLKIAGCRNGFYKPEEEQSIVDLINQANPDILLIGMSSPKKELFCQLNRNSIRAKYILGVGGYFDILSGYTKRAPRWMQNIGMEWFFRFVQEPRRMWRRYLIGINQFFWIVLKEKFRKRRKDKLTNQ